MSEPEGYNGWANSETWLVSLYLDGNYDGECTYREVLDIARSVRTTCELDGTFEHPHADRIVARDLGEYLEEWTSDRIGQQDLLVTDLLARSLGRVDWTRLAESKLAEIEEMAS